MKLKLGIAPIAWSNYDMPELGGDTPIEQCWVAASFAGFTGIELGPVGFMPEDPSILSEALDEFGQELIGGVVFRPFH